MAVRFETHRVGVYLVEMLKMAAPVREVTVDGGDIIQLVLETGETLSFHLIESSIELYEIRSVLRANTNAGIYTVFMLWRDMFLPPHGFPYAPTDWATALFDLYGCVYAYDFNGPDIFIFPVYLEAAYPKPTIRFGRTIDPSRLTAQMVRLNSGPLPGFWRVAGFDGQTGRYGPARFYEALGIAPDASLAAIKRAYRRLARQLHPDVNTSPDAHARMQALNEAYRAILEERRRD